MGETVWGTRRPGEKAMVVDDPDLDVGLDMSNVVDGRPAAVVFGDFYGADAIGIPAETPSFNGAGLHPLAGRRVRVRLAFRSVDPTGRCPGHQFTHLWSAEGDIGVAETPAGFVVYQASTFPSDWPKLDAVERA